MIFGIGLSFLISLCLALVLTPIVIWIAPYVGGIDLPNARKVHSQPMPRIGGIAVFLSAFIAFIVLYFIAPDMPYFAPEFSQKGLLLGASLILVILLGIVDDIKTLDPGQKFLVQLVAASLVYMAGFRISAVTNLWGFGLLEMGILDYPVTIIWIVGVTNAINLIDGLDGLASGVSLIAFITIGAISYLQGEIVTAMLVPVFAGAVVGFLRYNFNPAKIFLGDSGSLFIGFTLASLSMQSSTKGSTAFAVLVPMLALGLPIMDTFLSMTRRFLHSLLPEQKSNAGSWRRRVHGMFLPDRQHIHHQLISMGLRHRHAVLVLYLVSCLFGLVAFTVTVANSLSAALVLIVIATVAFFAIRRLKYREMAILRNGILLPLYKWPMVNREFYRGLLDLGFISVSFIGAYLISGQSTEFFGLPSLANLGILCGIQLAIFYLTGVHKSSYLDLGVGDFLKVTRNVLLAVLVSGLVLAFRPDAYSLTILVLDFYFLLTLVVGIRMSFSVLNYLFLRESRGKVGRHVLIYGADTTGLLIMKQILNDDSLDLAPIGFIDESPQLEGKRMDGLPIYGHWKLPRLLNKHKIDQILLPRDSASPEVLRRLQQTAGRYGIEIKRMRFELEELRAEVKVSAA